MFYRLVDDYYLVHLRVTPNASSDALGAVQQRDDGSFWLMARVRAIADKGKANKAVIELLAKAVGVPKSVVVLVSGDTNRQKVLKIPQTEATKNALQQMATAHS